jgi:hypothetical protein
MAMGYKPGPVFSEILRTVEDAQLEGQITDKERAIQYVEAKFAREKAQKSHRSA